MAKTHLSFANGLNLTNQSNKQMNTTFAQYFWNIFSTIYAMNKLSHDMRKNSLYHLHPVKTKINLHTCNLIWQEIQVYSLLRIQENIDTQAGLGL